MENSIRHNMKAYLAKKYDEKTYRLNSWWCDLPLEELENKFINFTADYYGAHTDWDFLEDILVWRRCEENVLGKGE